MSLRIITAILEKGQRFPGIGPPSNFGLLWLTLELSLVAQMVKNLPATWETWVWSLGWEDPVEKGKATHFQYSGLENSMDYTVHELQRVGYD